MFHKVDDGLESKGQPHDAGMNSNSESAVCWSMTNLRGKIAIIGIAKRLEEIYFPDDPVPLYIDKNSETLKIIQQLRNEAHRFGINFHRQKRSGTFTSSELDIINGVGVKTRESLINHFGSLEKLRKASLNEIAAIVGNKKAEIIRQHFDESEEKQRKNL